MAFNVQTLSLAPTSNTDANFRLWGGGISAALATVGLVQTADTGQINWTTVSRAATSLQSRGYEIWRFSDSLQATRPVYIRLDYGGGYYAANPPGLYAGIATGTDGAGLLTSATGFPNTTLWSPGNAAVPFSINGTGAVFVGAGNDFSSTSLNNLYVASDGGSSLLIAGWWNANGSTYPTQTGGLLLIERTRDQDGTPNGDGLLATRCSASAAPLSALMMIGKAQSYYGSSTGNGVPTIHGAKQAYTPMSALVGGTLNTFPIFTGVAPQLCGPSKHVVALFSADQSVSTEFGLTLYGATTTFRSMGTHTFGWASEGGSSAITGAFRVA